MRYMGMPVPNSRYVNGPAHEGAAAPPCAVKKPSMRRCNHILKTPSLITETDLLARQKREDCRSNTSTAADRLASRQLAQLPLAPSTRIRRAHLATTSTPLLHALVFLAYLLAPPTATLHGRRIAKVTVNADQIARHAVDLDVLHDNAARPAVAGAVAARAVQLAGVDDCVVLDGDGAAAVVLHDFVDGLLRAAALDEGVAGAEDGDGVWVRRLVLV